MTETYLLQVESLDKETQVKIIIAVIQSWFIKNTIFNEKKKLLHKD